VYISLPHVWRFEIQITFIPWTLLEGLFLSLL
jgi:hypothetical protein